MRLPPPRMRRPSAPMVVALAALFVALGGPAQAAKLIDGKKIRKNSITTKQVRDGTLKPRDLSSRALGVLTATPAGSITEPKLGENAVSTRALAPGSVLTGTVADDTLTAADLGANSVGADEVADNAVGQPEIRNNGVGASELADNTIGAEKVKDGSLTVGDVAQQVGTFSWAIGPLDTDECEVAIVDDLTLDIAGDHVLASPIGTWPSQLIYTVNGTATSSAFRVQACNRGAPTTTTVTYRFNYAVLGY